MVRIFKVTDLAERKRLLIAQSDVDRQTLKVQLAAARIAFEHIRTRLVGLELSSFAIRTAGDIFGLFASQARPAAAGGFISKVISGFKFFNQVKGLFGRFRSAAPHDGAE